ncbi:MAG: hypothetical protein A2Y43_02415 [Tenericutes bacterium GWA2_38_26]|nr:MAG: hypothetical protein A2Y43_02415 [Tenericutes bacterium GWA2_38_26]
MKNTVRLFALFLLVGLLFVVAGCKEDEVIPTIIPEITEYNVLGNWADGGDAVYTIATNTAAELDFTYNKSTFPDAYLTSPEITEDLSIFKKLVITVEGTGTMYLKLETNDDTPAKMVGLNVTGIAGTYEWNLMAASAFLAKVDRVVIVAAPGKELSVGSISITSLMFETAVADGYIINDDFNNIPSNVNEYNGTDQIFDFNDKWESNDEGIYTITYEGVNTIVDYDKPAGMEWAFMKTQVQGTFTAFNYVVFIVEGTSGQKLLIKPNEYNDAESFIWLDGTEQELVLDLTELTLAEKNAITDFKVFIAAGLAPAEGQLTIKEAYMIDDYEFEQPVIEVNTYNGTDNTFGVEHWYDGGDLVYDIAKVGTDYIVDYEKLTTNLHWAFMYANLEGDFTNFAKLEFEMTGTLNKTVLLKVESPTGNKEVQFTFDGTKQVFTIDLSTMTPTQLADLNKVVMFAAPGGVGAGEFTIHSVTFKTSDYEIDTEWTSGDAGVYTFATGETTVITYNKIAGQEWSFTRNILDAVKVAGLNTLTLVVKGTAGKSILVKPNDSGALEQTIAFTDANPVTVTFTTETFVNIIIFAEPNVAPAAGSFEIVSATLSYVAPDFDPSLVVNFNEAWVANSATIYTITPGEDSTVVAYDKLAGNDWEWMRVQFDAKDVAGLNTLTLVVKGTAGKNILIKPNDSGALEEWVYFTDSEPVTVVVHAASFANVFIFGDAGIAPASGSFEILTATLSYVADFNATWEENDADTYEVVAGDTVVVNYTKGAGQEWVFLKNVINPNLLVGMNTFTIVLEGTAGKSVMVKVNNSVEQAVTFVADTPATLTFTLLEITSVIIFAEPGTASVTGSFEIISAQASYVAPVVIFDPLAVLDLMTGWVENDLGTYAVVEGETVEITYTKAAGQEWIFVKNPFEVEAAMGMNTVNLVLQGTLDKQVLVKVNNSIEQWVTFTAEPTVVTIMADSITGLIIFAEGGTAPATGTFTILSAYLSYTENLQSTWEENDLGTYAFAGTGPVVVTYTKAAGQEWVFMKSMFDAVELTGMNTVTIVLEGTAGKQVLVKVNNAIEQWVTFVADTPAKVVITAPEITGIILFAEGGVAPVTGTFEIISATLSYVEPAFDPTAQLDLLAGWVENDLGTYAVVEGATTVITYTKGATQEWIFVKNPFDAELTAGMNTFTISLQGTAGKTLMIKVNNAIEKSVTFVGTETQTVVFYAATIDQVIIFAEPGTPSVTGSFTIVEAFASYSMNLLTGWVENDLGTYAVTGTGPVVVNYTKIAGQEWVFLNNPFDTDDAIGLNTFTIVLEGTAGKQVLVKVNNSIEQWVTFVEGEKATVTITAATITSVILFAEGGVAPVTGSFSILSASLSYVE